MSQYDQQSETITQPCPNCSASPEYREWRQFISSSGSTGYTNIRSEKHKLVGSHVTPLVCTQCGYVQIFVDPADFRKE